MQENQDFKIRLMTLDDLDQAINLSYSEGWNQTEKDWRLFLGNPANRCIVAEQNNKIAGTATALCHSDKVAWIGMVLVEKSLRGKGVGKQLMTYLINNLKHIKSIKLDATSAGEPLYKKLGFEEEQRLFRMTNPSIDSFVCSENYEKPIPIENEALSEIIKFDEKIFGTGRSYLLTTLFRDYPEKAFHSLINNKTEGYILGRNGARFNYIGPVSALSEKTAISLISKALQSLNKQSVALDVLADKDELIAWLESVGFVKQRHFVRMFLKSNDYHGITENQYLISGPEFG
jgi:GNAT superfamily N-acetyltransferase